MKIDTSMLADLHQQSDVVVGNIYPAKGGRKTPGTTFWLVVAVSGHGAHLIGFNEAGEPVSTSSYGKHALRNRPILARADLSQLSLSYMEKLT